MLKRFMMLNMVLILFLTGCHQEPQSDTDKQDATVIQQTAASQKVTEGCRITFFDTGKSDCILIETKDIVVLNDTADEDDYTTIQKALDDKKIDKIDYMIISHFDKDHIGSAADIINNNEVGCVLIPDYEEDSDQYRAMMQAIQDSCVEKKTLDNTYGIPIEDGSIAVNVPHEESYKDENNFSLITTVTYRDQSVLLMGDALKRRTEEFVNDVPPVQGQYVLVKTPHHGDYNKKLKGLLSVVKPQYAVITDSIAQERVEDKLTDLLKEEKCEVLFTHDGNIVVTMKETGVFVEQE